MGKFQQFYLGLCTAKILNRWFINSQQKWHVGKLFHWTNCVGPPLQGSVPNLEARPSNTTYGIRKIGCVLWKKCSADPQRHFLICRRGRAVTSQQNIGNACGMPKAVAVPSPWERGKKIKKQTEKQTKQRKQIRDDESKKWNWCVKHGWQRKCMIYFPVCFRPFDALSQASVFVSKQQSFQFFALLHNFILLWNL